MIKSESGLWVNVDYHFGNGWSGKSYQSGDMDYPIVLEYRVSGKPPTLVHFFRNEETFEQYIDELDDQFNDFPYINENDPEQEKAVKIDF